MSAVKICAIISPERRQEYYMPDSVCEYACHEGDSGLRDILSGARREEKAAAESASTTKKQ